MPTAEENNIQSTEIVTDFNSVSENNIDNDLLRDIANQLKVINENEILIIHRLDKISGADDSLSNNDIQAIRKGVDDILQSSVSANEITYDEIITKEFSEYTVTESFLLIMTILLFLLLVFNFLKGKFTF